MRRRWRRALIVAASVAAAGSLVGGVVYVVGAREAAPGAGQVVEDVERVGEAVGWFGGYRDDGATAFFITPDTVVTAWHVMLPRAGYTTTRVAMADGREFSVDRVVGVDERADVAVLRVSPRNEGAVLAVDPSPVAAGERLTAVTSPLVRRERNRVEGEGRMATGVGFFGELVAVRAATGSGWSGSPVVDGRGRVRGVLTSGEGLESYAAPAGTFQRLRFGWGRRLASYPDEPRTTAGEAAAIAWSMQGDGLGEYEPFRELLLRSALEKAPDHGTLLVRLGGLLCERGELEEGMGLLKRGVETSASPSVALLELAKAHEAAGEAAAAAAARARARELDPQLAVADAMKDAAFEALKEERWDAAIADFEALVGLMPDNPGYRMGVAAALAGAGREPESLPHLRHIARLWPDSTFILLKLATALENLEMYEQAAEVLRRATNRSGDPKMERRLDRARLRTEPIDEELARRRAAFEMYVGHRFAARQLVWALLEVGDPDGAVETLTRFLAAMPGDEWGTSEIVEILQNLGRHAEAAHHLRAGFEAIPGDRVAAGSLSRALLSGGELDAAAEVLTRFLDKSPEDAWGRRELGRVLRRMGRVEESIEQARIAVELEPRNAVGHYELGAAHARAERHEEALGCYQEAFRLDPSSDAIAGQLGFTLELLGRSEEAEEHLRAYLEQNPVGVASRTFLGRVLLRNHRAAEAVQELRIAAEHGPTSVTVHHWLGVALYFAGEYEEAAAALRRAFELSPAHEQTAERLGVVLLEAGRAEEAEAMLRAFLAEHPDAGLAHGGLGMVLRAGERHEEAAAHLQRGVAGAPDYTPWRIALAESLHALGRTEEALSVLEEGVAVDGRNHKLRERAVWFAATLGLRERAAEHLAVLRDVDASAAGELAAEFEWLTGNGEKEERGGADGKADRDR